VSGLGGRLKAQAGASMRAALLRQAGTALHAWMTETGLSCQGLQDALDRGEDVLGRALQSLPREGLATAQQLARPLLASITPAEYPIVLQQLAAWPETACHAQLLYQSHYYHAHFVPALERARAWLAGNAGG
jgi:hypothetical protein